MQTNSVPDLLTHQFRFSLRLCLIVDQGIDWGATMQPSGHGLNRSSQQHGRRPISRESRIRKTPNDVALPTESSIPPFKNRIQISREQSVASAENTEKGHAEIKSALTTNSNATTHCIMPQTIMAEVAVQFWHFVEAYRPTDVIGVNAILELAQCSWKNRRLFEQYISNNSREQLVMERRRRSKNAKLAQRWFQRLRQEPIKALNQLRQTTEGLGRIISSLDSIASELDQTNGSWTSRQFETIVNLSGFSIFEIWSQVSLRKLWVAWYSSYPDREIFMRSIFNPVCPPEEFHWRVFQATEDARTANEGRWYMKQYANRLQMQFKSELEELQGIEAKLDELNCMATGWVDGNNSFQHLLHLRHSNLIDRRTRDLLAMISKAPKADSKKHYQFDIKLLPLDWRKFLTENRPVNQNENTTTDTNSTHTIDHSISIAIQNELADKELNERDHGFKPTIKPLSSNESARIQLEELYQQLGLNAITETAKARQDQIDALDQFIAAQVVYMNSQENQAELNQPEMRSQPQEIRIIPEIKFISQEEIQLPAADPEKTTGFNENKQFPDRRYPRRNRSRQIRQDSKANHRPNQSGESSNQII